MIMGIVNVVVVGIVIPLMLLLTVSFFILFAIRKTDAGALRIFGYVITTLLWLSAIVLIISGAQRIIMSQQQMKHGQRMMMERGQGQGQAQGQLQEVPIQ